MHLYTVFSMGGYIDLGGAWVPGTGFINLGTSNISGVTEVPASGHNATGPEISSNIGTCFAIKLRDGKYAVVKISGLSSFQYKYQPDGSRFF